ncbi:MAG: bifunctional precorrin-2 dehydrogenase/sirohydrochlorin ferrochelatase [Spirochaetes bacterium]|nr:MAG: bifunctional precorrin-2 dehydrogenase/sirohydrochlorin ferrochelatase [Spirochaetota bacterium]
MLYYPVLLDIKDKLVVVIGGGEVALRKVADLCRAGARVRVIAPRVHEGIASRAADGAVSINTREYAEGDLEGAALVFSCTNDALVNARVYREAHERGIFINAVDDPPHCSFIVPSFTQRGDFLLAVSTSGASPAMAARLRRMIEKAVPENVEVILEALREARRIIQGDASFKKLSADERGDIMKRIVNDDALLDELAAAFREHTLSHYLRIRAGLPPVS